MNKGKKSVTVLGKAPKSKSVYALVRRTPRGSILLAGRFDTRQGAIEYAVRHMINEQPMWLVKEQITVLEKINS